MEALRCRMVKMTHCLLCQEECKYRVFSWYHRLLQQLRLVRTISQWAVYLILVLTLSTKTVVALESMLGSLLGCLFLVKN